VHFLNFHKTFITWKVYSNYRLQLWCDDSHNILLYSQWILYHANCRVSVRVNHVWKLPFYASFGSSMFRTGGLLQLLTLDLWSRKPKLSTNQVGRLLWPCNGDRLKNSKKKKKKKKIAFCTIWSLFSYPTTTVHTWLPCNDYNIKTPINFYDLQSRE